MGGCQSKNDSYRGFVQTLAGIHFKLFANEVKFDLLLGPGTFGSRHLFCYQRYLKEQAKSGPWTMTGMKLHFFLCSVSMFVQSAEILHNDAMFNLSLFMMQRWCWLKGWIVGFSRKRFVKNHLALQVQGLAGLHGFPELTSFAWTLYGYDSCAGSKVFSGHLYS